MTGSKRFGSRGRLVMLAAVACLAGQAGAAMPGLYFAGFYMDSTLAYASVDGSASGLDADVQGIWEGSGFDVDSWQSNIADKTDIGYAFSVGFQFSQYLAAELGWVDMGTIHYEAAGAVSEGGSSYNSSTFVSAKTKGPLLAGIGIWPLGDRWSLDARAGMLFGKTRLKAAAYLEGTYIGEASEKDNKNAVMLGAGVNWAMSPGTAIRVGYTRLTKAMVDQYDVNAWTLGLKYAW
jgi:OOP family OmpA-OmpF porin